MNSDRLNSTPTETRWPTLRSLSGFGGSAGVRLVLALLLIAAATAMTWFRTAEDLAAASEVSTHQPTGIRLQVPAFGEQPESPSTQVPQNDDQPLPGMQIVPRNTSPPRGGPVIRSRQETSHARELRAQQQRPYAAPGNGSFASQTQELSDTGAATAEAAETWSVPPEKRKSTPEEFEQQFRQEPSQQWSVKPPRSEVPQTEARHRFEQFRPLPEQDWSLEPQSHNSTPAQTEQQFRKLPDQQWSLLPDSAATVADESQSRTDGAAPSGEVSVGDPRTVPPSHNRTPPPASAGQPLSAPVRTTPRTPVGNSPSPGTERQTQIPVQNWQAPDNARQPSAPVPHWPSPHGYPVRQPAAFAQPPPPGVPVPASPVPGSPVPVSPVPVSPAPVESVPGVFVPGLTVPSHSQVTPGVPIVPGPPGGVPVNPGAPSALPEYPSQVPATPSFAPADPSFGPAIPQHPPGGGAQPLIHEYRPEIQNLSPEPPVYEGHSIPPAISSGPALGGHSVFGIQPGTSGFRATIEQDAAQWMSPYNQRASQADGFSGDPPMLPVPSPLPPGFTPWWDSVVRQPTGISPSTIPVDVGTLLQDALLYSPQVTAIKTEPEVQYRVITQEAAKFDWTAFLETNYDDLNDPVGNELTTGNGQDRLLTKKWRGEGGFRRKNLEGGEFRIAQRIGHENQNSRFFVPNNQGTARLEMTYRQPLLDGRGRPYNESEIVLARIQANASEDDVVEALQNHLIEVTKAYWAMYRARAEYFQRQKLLSSAQTVLARLEGRSQVDTIPRQVLRAKAAVARAQTRIQRTMARVQDAEAQLRLLVNSPGMLNGGPTELTPMEPPGLVTENADLQSILQTALINRPDISEAIRQMRASSVRLGVSRTELLPRLDFLVEAYVADLSGNSDIARALNGQYLDNRPGYTVGLEFELQIDNRAARAKLEQRQWELKRSINVFRATVEKSLTDVEIANREVATAYSEVLSHYQSMTAAENETNYLQDRFNVLPASEDSATLLLEDLLDSFERLADEESAFVQAQVDHATALVILKKELGILLQSRHAQPSVESSEQQWFDERLGTAFDIPEKVRKADPEGETAVAATAEQLPQKSSGPTLRVESFGGTTRPVRATPATWARSAGLSRPKP